MNRLKQNATTGIIVLGLFFAYAADAQQFPQSLLDYFSGLTEQSPTSATSTLTLTASPNPIQTRELVIVEARLPGANDPFQTDFTWYINGTKRDDLSGRGSNVAAFAGPDTPGSVRIRVESKNGKNTFVADQVFSVELSALSKAYLDLEAAADELIQQKDELLASLNFTIEISPRTPKPGDQVEAAIKSFQFDPGEAEIVWFSNGRKIAEGRGVTSAATVIPSNTNSLEIRAVATMRDGRRGERSIFVSPSTIDFYWWTDTYVPAWYKGKALPSRGSTILVEARPSLPTEIASSLTYAWYLNGVLVPGLSGPGKSIFPYTIPFASFLQEEIRVRASNRDETIVQEAVFMPPLAEQRALVYQVKPLEGVNHSQTVVALVHPVSSSIDLIVEPFFLPKYIVSSLSYQWNLNGVDLSSAGAREPQLFTLTSSATAAGLQRINVTLESKKEPSITLSNLIDIELE